MILGEEYGFTFNANFSWDSQRIDLRCVHRGSSPITEKLLAIVQPATLVDYDRSGGGNLIQPFLRLSEEDAQRLVNALWDAGVRPSRAKGSAGQLDAVNRHLEDMRKLVFDANPRQ